MYLSYRLFYYNSRWHLLGPESKCYYDLQNAQLVPSSGYMGKQIGLMH